MKQVKVFDDRLVVDWDSVNLTQDNLCYALLLKDYLTRFRDSYLSAHSDFKNLLGDYDVDFVITVKI